MRRKEGLPELLAPAGDFDCLVAAVSGGADAVYVGGKSFGARAFATNFDIEGLTSAVGYCHLHGVKLYVTVNTLLLDSELSSAVEFATELYRIGVDALIVADLGLVRELRRVLPNMELHASTQMSIHNTEGADMAYELGCTRVVLAREVSGDSIAKITEKCKAQTEVFLHGALCVCHSGQCLFSSLVGGRSGNRGECAQPCRLPYGNGYPLSLTDLSLAEHIPSLIRSGVASLKIEGRMKSPDYVYTVTSIYRRLLDEGRVATREERERLLRAFSRGGFTDGYYTGKIESKGMLGIRSGEDKRASREDRDSLGKEVTTPTRVKIFAEATLRLGEPARLTFKLPRGRESDERTATVFGDTPSTALSRPLEENEVKARLCKLGGTYFSLAPDDISLSLDEGINLSPAALNALRRSAVAALLEADPCRHADFSPSAPVGTESFEARVIPEIRRTAILYNPALFDKSGIKEKTDLVFIPLWRFSEITDIEGCGIALPPVVMEEEYKEVKDMARAAVERGVKYALVGNLGQLSLCRELALTPIGDFRFNITNRSTGATLSSLGVNNYLLSPELTAPQARAIGGSSVVYGRIPLMITERCFMRDTHGCRECSSCSLTDRRGARFPMIREYNHRTLILNSAVTYMGDKTGEVRGLGEHYIFTTESADEIRAVLDASLNGEGMPLSLPFRRMGRRAPRAD